HLPETRRAARPGARPHLPRPFRLLTRIVFMLKLVDSGARSHLPFSPAFIAGDLMFVSGQASVDRDTGAIVSGSFEEEMRRSIENLRAILEAGGLSLDHVV